MARRPPALWEGTNEVLWVMIPMSLGLHGLLALVVFVGSLLRPHSPPPPPSYEVMLMAPIKRGTPGGGTPKLSDAASAKATPAPPVPVPTVKAPDMVLPDPNAKRDPKAEKAKLEALERMKADQAKQDAMKRLLAKNTSTNTAKAVTAAPAATPGAGDGAGDGGVEYGTWDGIPGSASYEQQLFAIVNKNWSAWIKPEPQKCIIRVVIGFDGKITSREFEERSADASFDASAMAAVIKSDPFPPPPIDLKIYLARKGIPLRFNSQNQVSASNGGGTP